MVNLGNMFLNGLCGGTSKAGAVQATRYYQAAAKQGDVVAMRNLCNMKTANKRSRVRDDAMGIAMRCDPPPPQAGHTSLHSPFLRPENGWISNQQDGMHSEERNGRRSRNSLNRIGTLEFNSRRTSRNVLETQAAAAVVEASTAVSKQACLRRWTNLAHTSSQRRLRQLAWGRWEWHTKSAKGVSLMVTCLKRFVSWSLSRGWQTWVAFAVAHTAPGCQHSRPSVDSTTRSFLGPLVLPKPKPTLLFARRPQPRQPPSQPRKLPPAPLPPTSPPTTNPATSCTLPGPASITLPVPSLRVKPSEKAKARVRAATAKRKKQLQQNQKPATRGTPP